MAAIEVQKLIPAIHPHQSAGSQVETTSYQERSGASSCAAFRAKRRSPRTPAFKGSTQSERSHASIANPELPHCHSAEPRLRRVPEAIPLVNESRKTFAELV